MAKLQGSDGPTGSSSRRRRVIIVVLAVITAVVAAGAVVAVLNREGPAAPVLPPAEHQVKPELIKAARPDPRCAELKPEQPSGRGDVRIGVIRLRGHCLITETVLAPAAEAEATLAELRGRSDVVAADRAQEVPPAAPEDPHPATEGQQERQWSLERLGGADAIRALWPDDAPEVRVGVVDSGIDAEQAEFGDRVIAVKDTELGGDDYESHGTFVAGIIAAADDGTGMTGLAPKATLLDAQYWRGGESVGEEGIHDEIIWAVDHGAKVINASAGSSSTSLLRAAYDYAELNRVVIIAAVGNCGTSPWRPWPREWSEVDERACPEGRNRIAGQADQPTALGVGAVNEDGDRAGFSSVNRTVMIMAPGEDVLSTCVSRLGGPRTLCTGSGTSYAAPQVAGAAAILLARHPEATPADIRQALIMSADPVKVERGGRNDEYGYGRLNVIAAARYLDDHPPQPVPPEPEIAAATITGDDHRTELVGTDGRKIPVQQLGGDNVPAIAFSKDGAWFAATDGKHLTVVDAGNGRQQSTECSCRGVAFGPDNEVITVTRSDPMRISHYDPYTADWVSTINAQQGGLTGYTVRAVGTAGDLTIVVGMSSYAGQRSDDLLGVGPDGQMYALGDRAGEIGQVAVSDDGHWLAYSGSSTCSTDRREIRLIDLKKQLSGGRSVPFWATWLTPVAATSCATTSLHFEGSTLGAGWVAGGDGVRDTCPDAGGVAVVSGRLTIKPFQPSESVDRTRWTELGCGQAGVWHPADGGQLQLRPVPASPGLRRMPDHYALVRKEPKGNGETVLADNAAIIVVRPR